MVKIGLLSALKRELPEVIPYGKSKYVQTYNIGDYAIGVLLSGIGQKRAEKQLKDYAQNIILIILYF